MKYAIVIPCDQTIAYFADELGEDLTLTPARAFLWSDRAACERIIEMRESENALLKDGWKHVHDIEPIDDVEEFKARPDTW